MQMNPRTIDDIRCQHICRLWADGEIQHLPRTRSQTLELFRNKLMPRVWCRRLEDEHNMATKCPLERHEESGLNYYHAEKDTDNRLDAYGTVSLNSEQQIMMSNNSIPDDIMDRDDSSDLFLPRAKNDQLEHDAISGANCVDYSEQSSQDDDILNVKQKLNRKKRTNRKEKGSKLWTIENSSKSVQDGLKLKFVAAFPDHSEHNLSSYCQTQKATETIAKSISSSDDTCDDMMDCRDSSSLSVSNRDQSYYAKVVHVAENPDHNNNCEEDCRFNVTQGTENDEENYGISGAGYHNESSTNNHPVNSSFQNIQAEQCGDDSTHDVSQLAVESLSSHNVYEAQGEDAIDTEEIIMSEQLKESTSGIFCDEGSSQSLTDTRHLRMGIRMVVASETGPSSTLSTNPNCTELEIGKTMSNLTASSGKDISHHTGNPSLSNVNYIAKGHQAHQLPSPAVNHDDNQIMDTSCILIEEAVDEANMFHPCYLDYEEEDTPAEIRYISDSEASFSSHASRNVDHITRPDETIASQFDPEISADRSEYAPENTTRERNWQTPQISNVVSLAHREYIEIKPITDSVDAEGPSYCEQPIISDDETDVVPVDIVSEPNLLKDGCSQTDPVIILHNPVRIKYGDKTYHGNLKQTAAANYVMNTNATPSEVSSDVQQQRNVLTISEGTDTPEIVSPLIRVTEQEQRNTETTQVEKHASGHNYRYTTMEGPEHFAGGNHQDYLAHKAQQSTEQEQGQPVQQQRTANVSNQSQYKYGGQSFQTIVLPNWRLPVQVHSQSPEVTHQVSHGTNKVGGLFVLPNTQYVRPQPSTQTPSFNVNAFQGRPIAQIHNVRQPSSRGEIQVPVPSTSFLQNISNSTIQTCHYSHGDDQPGQLAHGPVGTDVPAIVPLATTIANYPVYSNIPVRTNASRNHPIINHSGVCDLLRSRIISTHGDAYVHTTDNFLGAGDGHTQTGDVRNGCFEPQASNTVVPGRGNQSSTVKTLAPNVLSPHYASRAKTSTSSESSGQLCHVKCSNCENPAICVCIFCQRACYCSLSCQTSAWATHRKACTFTPDVPDVP